MSIKDSLFNSAKEISKYLAVNALFNKIFSRYDRPDYDITPGLINIERTNLKRKELEFDSKGYKLRGYYYPNCNNKLIVICHGLRSGADDYLPFINFFINNGYECFSFNNKGTYESEGNRTFGLSESLIDLESAIKFIKSNDELKNKDLYLFGHSWGGFAVCSILNIYPDVKAVASISGYNDASTLIVDKGVFYAGEMANYPKKYIDKYQEETFGDYLKYNALDGINNTKAKVLLAHGNFDLIIDFNTQSIISNVNKIINPNIKYYIGTSYNNGHDTILYSKEAVLYQKQVKKDIKKYDKNSFELKEYIKEIDHFKYSEPNPELFKMILEIFN